MFAFKVINNVQLLAHSSLCQWPQLGKKEGKQTRNIVGLLLRPHPNDPFYHLPSSGTFTGSLLSLP